jgi:hypothetical protein
MLFTNKETLEDKIIRYLLPKQQTAKGLLKQLKEESGSYTIQALYVVLRNLATVEVVVKRGTYYFLNEEWRTNVASQLKKQENNELAEGESVSYVLSSLIHHDLQWKNIVLPLHESHPHDPIFFYNFHYIWLHLSESRKQSELSYYASIAENKNHAFSLVGSKSVYDIEVKKKLQNEFVQWAVGTEHFSKTDYITVFSDYIITTRISNRLAEEIEECYTNNSNNVSLETRLQKIGIEKKKVRLIIERDKDKAKKLRKKLSKEFFVQKDLIEKFNLY